MKRALIYSIGLLFFFVAIWIIKARIDKRAVPDKDNPVYDLSKKIQYGFTLRNKTNHLVTFKSVYI